MTRKEDKSESMEEEMTGGDAMTRKRTISKYVIKLDYPF